jgi:hypothetical protein
VFGHPFGNEWEILALLTEVVFHCEIDKIDRWLSGYELHLRIQVSTMAWISLGKGPTFSLMSSISADVQVPSRTG